VVEGLIQTLRILERAFQAISPLLSYASGRFSSPDISCMDSLFYFSPIFVFSLYHSQLLIQHYFFQYSMYIHHWRWEAGCSFIFTV